MPARRLLIAGPAIGGALVLGATPAFAASPRPSPTPVPGTVHPSSVGVGGSVTFCGSGFLKNSDIALTDNGAAAHPTSQTVASSTGTFCVTETLTTTGSHLLQALGLRLANEAYIVEATVTVTAAPSAAPSPSPSSSVLGQQQGRSGSLPFTGTDTELAVVVGLGLISSGLAMRIASRRRGSH